MKAKACARKRLCCRSNVTLMSCSSTPAIAGNGKRRRGRDLTCPVHLSCLLIFVSRSPETQQMWSSWINKVTLVTWNGKQGGHMSKTTLVSLTSIQHNVRKHQHQSPLTPGAPVSFLWDRTTQPLLVHLLTSSDEVTLPIYPLLPCASGLS